MGIKNRPGCCCGSSEPPCYNVAGVCRGTAHAVLYVKNGKVKDDNGEWPLTISPGFFGGVTSWSTEPIKFTTNKWTDGDCTPKNGDAYYSYEVGFGITQDAALSCIMRVSTRNCGAVTLYTGDKTPNAQQVQGKDDAHVTCDPIGGSFDYAKISGLDPPSKKAVVAFEVDDEATRSCGCRACRAAFDYPSFSPLGDIALAYEIDYPGTKKSGAVDLKRMDADSSTLHQTINGNVFLYTGTWKGDLGWWGQPSCSNPTNDKRLWNISYSCGFASFLRWCNEESPPQATPHLSQRPSPTRSKIIYDLIDPAATPPKQGTITLIDKDAAGFDGVCCPPCVLPKKDIAVSSQPIGTSTTSYGFVLKFFENTKLLPGVGPTAFQWAIETPLSKKYDPLNPAAPKYPFYPGSNPFPPDPGITIGATYQYHVYLSCDAMYWAWIKPDGTDYAINLWEEINYTTNTQNGFPPYAFNQTSYACEPFHFSNRKGSGGDGFSPLVGRTLRLDEVEP